LKALGIKKHDRLQSLGANAGKKKKKNLVRLGDDGVGEIAFGVLERNASFVRPIASFVTNKTVQ
jgi:hypothetical protein